MQDATIAAIRFGFGFRAAPQPGSPDAVLAALAGPDTMVDRYPLPDLARARAMLLHLKETQVARRDNPTDATDAAAQQARRALSVMPSNVLRATLARICDGESPMRERLARFWVDHFTIATNNTAIRGLSGDFVDGAIRANLSGRFADLLRAAVTHPAMLVYLDQVNSVGPGSPVGRKRNLGLNENLAREALELHTLGVGSGYSQTDVRQFAELLTGLGFQAGRDGAFRANQAEPGAEDILGRRYGSDDAARIDDIHAFLDDLAVHSDTARHVSRKLAVHFVSDDPPQDLVESMVAAWARSDGDLMKVYAALVEHPAARGPVGGKAKQPFDFVASSFCALGVRGADVDGWPLKMLQQIAWRPMDLMGQRFMRPDGPDGWSEEAARWITPLGLSQRIRWAERIPRRLLGDAMPDPRAFVVTALGDAAGERLTWAVGASETVPQGIALILASPEFNRR